MRERWSERHGGVRRPLTWRASPIVNGGRPVPRVVQRLALGPVVVTIGAVLTACGAAGSASRTTSPGGAQGLSKQSAHVSSGEGGLSAARLGSLTDYSFISKSGNEGYSFTITGQVHDPTDWETNSTSPAVANYDVDGHGYSLAVGQVIPVTFKSPDGLTHLNGEVSYAQALIGYTHVTGIRIVTAGSCNVAGVHGTTYEVRSPGADASLLVETATACVADGSGALLSYSSGVPGGSAANATHLTGAETSFTVTAIGGVGAISAPQGSSTSTVTSPPPASKGTSGLPAGFPASVPAPPGKTMSSVALSSTKWYVELTESGSTAESGYVKVLQGKGFSVVDSSNTVAGDITTLSNGSFQVLVEQMSLPGQGVVMAVTVSTG